MDRAPRSAWTIALVSCAVILFEIGITRLLSVVLWYHHAFLVVSLAMLGLGAPGVWFSLRPPTAGLLRRLLLVSALAIPLSVALVAKSGEWIPIASLRIVAVVLALLAPFVLLGAAICVLLLGAPGRSIGRIYAFDLLGAAAGAALVVPLLHLVPTPSLLAGLAFLPLAAVWLQAPGSATPAVVAGLIALSLASGDPYRVRHGKVYGEEDLEVLHEVWTPTARLTVFPGLFFERNPEQAFGWGMGARFDPEAVEQLWVEQDGFAGTPITRLDGPPAALGHLLYDVTSVGYQLRPARRACIIGAGGGRDVLTALAAGAALVDAVELNGALIDIVSERFGDFSGGVYHLPGVRAHAAEGRSFLSRSDAVYDLIQISLIDSWAATTAGAYALSENFLYTREAMRLYLRRLADAGLVTISRWMDGPARLETARLALLAVAALEAEGVAAPLEHLAVVGAGRVGTVLVSKRPFGKAEIERLDAIAERRGFERHWPAAAATRERSIVVAVLGGGAAELERRGLFLSPPTDERPFFFQNVRAFDRVDADLARAFSINDDAARLPGLLAGVVFGIALLAFLSPFAIGGRATIGGPPRGSLYFLAIGLAFLWVEIPVIQKSILHLGHPSYATTVVLSTLLLGSGLGAWLAGRIELRSSLRFRFALPAAVALLAWLLPGLLDATLGWSFPARVAVSLAVLAPLGVLMGFPFPLGMIVFDESRRAWYWALNGVASVLASVATVALTPYLGFSTIIALGAAAYLLPCLLIGPVHDRGVPSRHDRDVPSRSFVNRQGTSLS